VTRFEPAERGAGWLVQDDLNFAGHVAPTLGVVADYAYKPLVVYRDDGSERGDVVLDHGLVHLGGSLVLANRVRLGLNLPLVFLGTGEQVVFRGQAYAAPIAGAMGDLRLAADVRLYGDPGQRFRLAVGARAWMPTGAQAGYSGDGKFRVAPQLLLAGDVGRFSYGARLGYTWRQREILLGDVSVGSTADFGLALGYSFLDGRLVVGPELFGSTRASRAAFRGAEGTPLEAMVGAQWRGQGFRASLGVTKGLTHGIGTPTFRVLGGVEFVVEGGGKKDADGDGIEDAVDACPLLAGTFSCDARKHGCPDRDGDGILDADDACPDVSGVASTEHSKQGCPLPPDADRDGILDADDACVNEPGTPSADRRFNGCPEKKDEDTDEVPDREDACLKEPGKRNADPKKNGCPVGAVVNGQLVLDQVKFKTDSAVILQESNETLGKILEAIRRLPDTNRYRVEGHTDAMGKPEYNKGLSQRRAQSVVQWFVQKGIPAKRLEARGYGQEKPLASNATEVGRQANRRVEIHILEGTNQLPARPAPAK
jgi:outer membrane protein OmpA-like peptidoglycan-associated protein